MSEADESRTPSLGEPIVVEVNRQKYRRVARARGAHMAVLVGAQHGAPHFETRRFLLDPGGRIPAHRHPDIEHEQLVLRGRLTIGLDDESHTVRPGDAIFIPAGTTHWYENRTTDPVEFLCVVPRTDEYVTEWLEDPPEDAYLPEE